MPSPYRDSWDHKIDKKATIKMGIIALGVWGILSGLAYICFKEPLEEHIEQVREAKARHEYKLQEAELFGKSGKGLEEKFYITDGKVVLVEIDGMPAEKYFKK